MQSKILVPKNAKYFPFKKFLKTNKNVRFVTTFSIETQSFVTIGKIDLEFRRQTIYRLKLE